MYKCTSSKHLFVIKKDLQFGATLNTYDSFLNLSLTLWEKKRWNKRETQKEWFLK